MQVLAEECFDGKYVWDMSGRFKGSRCRGRRVWDLEENQDDDNYRIQVSVSVSVSIEVKREGREL